MAVKYKEGTEKDYTVRTCAWSAPGCHPTGCGLIMHVKDGKLVEVEGDPEHPVSQGRVCVRCLSLPEAIYHPDRILYPMKRAGKKGEDKWERITWDEAYDLIEEKVRYYQKQYGLESIAMMGGTGREATFYFPALSYAVLQTPNNVGVLSGLSCYGPRCAVTEYVLGAGYPEIDYAAYFADRYDNPEFQLPEYIIIWGKSPLESNSDGFFGHAIVDMMKRGTKIIAVDPRVTWLTSRAEYHLQLRPGTDAALALGMLNVIINEDLYDHEFVEKWTFGLDALRERVQEYSPRKVADICWIKEETIVQAARAFAQAGNSSIQWGVALDMNWNGIQAIQGVLYLMTLTGNLDVPGGNTLAEPASFMGKWRYDTHKQIPEEIYENRIGNKEFPFFNYGLMACSPDNTLEYFEQQQPYPIKMVWSNSQNPLANAAPVPKRWYEAFKKIEFWVCQELFMTPTVAAYADIVLPIATFAEHDGVVIPHFGRNSAFLGAVNQCIERVGECKSDLEICFELGKRLNPQAWPWETVSDFFTEQIEEKTGLDYPGLKDKVVQQQHYVYKKYEQGLLRSDGEPGFETLTGLIELKATIFESWGEDPLPYFQEPPFSPYRTPELFAQYPLVLTTGGRKFTSFHSEHRQIPSLRQITPWPTVEIHPDTAAGLSIQDGDWVAIENHLGQCRMKALVQPTVHPKVVHALHGWWYPEQAGAEPNLFGTFKSNINMLMPHKKIGKLGLGANYKSNLCKVYKVSGLED